MKLTKLLPFTLSLILTTFYCSAEPNKLQKEMMNESASMMDIFILSHNIFFSQEDRNITIDEYSSFPLIKDKEYVTLHLEPTLEVALDWENGMFNILSTEVQNIKYFQGVKLTFNNAKNLCLSILEKNMEFHLRSDYADHNGYKNGKYLKSYKDSSMIKQVMKFIDMTKRKARLTILRYSKDKKKMDNFKVSCTTSNEDNLLENVKFTFEGKWL
jgi:hypothetical protein